MDSRREIYSRLADLHGDLAATHRLIAQEYAALSDPNLDPDVAEPPTEEPTEPPQTMPIKRVGRWIQSLRIERRTLDQRPDQPIIDRVAIYYAIKDLFTTRDGSWEPSTALGSIDQWARDAYLKPPSAPDYFDDAGASTHLFAAVIGLDGQLLRNHAIYAWSDGFAKLGDASYQGYKVLYTKERSGWANLFMSPSSSYVPERGEQGPWCWCPAGAADVVVGGGLPAKQHVSIFAVWQAVRL